MNQAFLKRYEVDLENQSITFSCASQFPCTRYDQKQDVQYEEILIIDEKSVNLDRLNNKAPLLFNHDTNKLIGVVEKAWVADQRVFVRVKLSPNDEFSKRVWADMVDGIIASISIGYTIDDYEDKKQNGIFKRYVTHFMIYEVSVVSIPADPTCNLRKIQIKENNMKKQCDKIEQKECDKIEQKACGEDENKLQEKELDKEQVIEAKEEVKDENKDEDIEAIKAENEELKAEIAKLKQEKEDKEDIEKEYVDDQTREEMEKIAEDFDVDKEEVERAIQNKLTIREFKDKIKTLNFKTHNNKENNIMDSKREFQDFLKRGEFDKSFTLRDFTGFGGLSGEGGESLIGTDTLPLLPALQKVMGVKGFTALNGLHFNATIPVQTTRNTVYQTANLRTAPSESNPAFTPKTLTPKKFAGSTVIGKQLLVQANQSVIAFVINSLSREIAYKLQDYMLGAVVAANPTQINYESLSAIDWADIVSFQTAISSYVLNEPAFVLSPAARGALKATPKASNYPDFLCSADNRINGYEARVSGCVSNNNIYYGDWSRLIVGFFGQGLQILINPFKFSAEGNVEVVASICADAVVSQVDAFAIGKVQSSSSESSESSSSL